MLLTWAKKKEKNEAFPWGRATAMHHHGSHTRPKQCSWLRTEGSEVCLHLLRTEGSEVCPSGHSRAHMSSQRRNGSFTTGPWTLTPFTLHESVETDTFPLAVCSVEHLAQAGMQYTRHQDERHRDTEERDVHDPRSHCTCSRLCTGKSDTGRGCLCYQALGFPRPFKRQK